MLGLAWSLGKNGNPIKLYLGLGQLMQWWKKHGGRWVICHMWKHAKSSCQFPLLQMLLLVSCYWTFLFVFPISLKKLQKPALQPVGMNTKQSAVTDKPLLADLTPPADIFNQPLIRRLQSRDLIPITAQNPSYLLT